LGIDPAITIKILGLMIAVDWINDRVRTLVNVSGDLAAILLTLNERSPLQLFMKSLRFSKSKLRMKNRATVKLSSNARDIA
jgi:Na+/H+-dicarboxylate symporter